MRWPRLWRRNAEVKRSSNGVSWAALSTATDGFNIERAAGLPAVQASVGLISESIATLPASIVRIADREKVTDHPLQKLLQNPAPLMSFSELLRALFRDVLLHGNAIARFHPTEIELEYIPWATVAVAETIGNRDLRFTFSREGQDQSVLASECVFLRDAASSGGGTAYGSAYNGLVGESRLHRCRQTIALALRLQDATAAALSNGIWPSGVVTVTGNLTSQQRAAIQNSFQLMRGAAANGSVFFADNQLDFKPVTGSAADLQLVQMQAFLISQISRVYQIPEVLLNSGESTYSNYSESAKQFAKQVLTFWSKIFEDAFKRALLLDEFELELDFRVFEKADIAQRAAWYNVLLSTGVITPEVVAALEGYDRA